MSVTHIDAWRLPGCSTACWPRSHDPQAHEDYGRLLEREASRPHIVRTGPLALDTRIRNSATVHGLPVYLTEREWELLAYLAERIGQRCQVEEMVAGAWGDTYAELPLAARNYARVAVGRMRQRLGHAGALISGSVGHGRRYCWRRLDLVEPTP